MFQCIHSMANDQFMKTAWIDITEEDTMAGLYLDLNKLEMLYLQNRSLYL